MAALTFDFNSDLTSFRLSNIGRVKRPSHLLTFRAAT